MEIAENGPLLIHADNLLKIAIDKYWSNTKDGKWHFISKTSEGLNMNSKVIVRLKKQRSKLSFMEN